MTQLTVCSSLPGGEESYTGRRRDPKVRCRILRSERSGGLGHPK